MASTNATIDSFIANSMEYIRTHGFDGIDLDWNFPGFCEGLDRCSPPSDALRFKILLKRFREAIESENVPFAKKFIISSSAGPKQNQIYGTTTSTTKSPAATTTTTTAATSISPVASALVNETHISTNITVTPDQMTDLKIEIWSPIIAVIVLALIVFLIVYCVKRKNAKITDDSGTQNPDHDFEEYENYGSDNSNNTTRKASYYSQYTSYDGVYEEYKQNVYAEYKKPKK